MKINELKLNKSNPRTIKGEQFKKLKKSLEDFPKMLALRPIVVDDDGTILGGNMRYRAIKELGWKEIPDEYVKRASDLTEEEKKRFIVEDNVGFGEWDFDMLANEFDDLDLTEMGVESFVSAEQFGEDFTLPDGERKGVAQMTFLFTTEQQEAVAEKIKEIQKSAKFKETEFENSNKNANAIFYVLKDFII